MPDILGRLRHHARHMDEFSAAKQIYTEAGDVIERQQQALEEAYRQIRLLAEAGVDRLADYGVKVDPAERTYEPIIERVSSIAKGPPRIPFNWREPRQYSRKTSRTKDGYQ